MDSETVPMQFQPFNWLQDAEIFNKKGDIISPVWLKENADVIVLLFTSKGIDREGIVQKFFNIYESIKLVNIAVEVINISFDETEKDYEESYAEQANWFTLKFGDPLINILQYSYGITSIPHMIVIKPDCSIISSHGLLDLEEYGKNAVITWLSTNASSKNHRTMSRDAQMYGENWRYASTGSEKKAMQMKFSGSSGFTSTSTYK